jgi:hypothetical protein
MHLNVSDRAPLARSCANAALLALVALVPTGCGFGTSGVLGASGGSSGTTNSQAVASDLIAPRSATSPATGKRSGRCHVELPRSVLAADVDGDGDLYLVTANRGGNDFTVFFGGR